MTWTATTPAQPGWYWHRAPGERVQACEVLEDHGRLYAAFPIGRGQHDWLTLTPTVDPDLPGGSEWFGPVHPPTDEKTLS